MRILQAILLRLCEIRSRDHVPPSICNQKLDGSSSFYENSYRNFVKLVTVLRRYRV